MIRPARLVLLAAALWWVAALLDLITPTELVVWNDHVEWTVAGSTITADLPVGYVTGVSIRGRDGYFPAGGRRMQAGPRQDDQQLHRLPERFDFAENAFPPVGDWWVDEIAVEEELLSFPADLGSEPIVRTVFSGRSPQHTRIVLDGEPGLQCSFRRGLINNDLHISDESGATVAHGSIDPRPFDSIGAIAANVLRTISIAVFLLALWRLFSRGQKAEPAFTRHALPGAVFPMALVLLAATAAGIAIWTSVDVFEGMPHTPDEVVYQLQAGWLTEGRLTGVEPPCRDHFEVPFTYFVGGRWIGHYPPLWPALLAPGVALGFPQLTSIVFRFLQVMLLGWLGNRLAGPWVGITSAAMATTSPLANLLGPSTLAHIGCATMLAAGVCLVLPSSLKTRPVRWYLCGVTFGLAFGIRPLTAVACALPVGLFLLSEIRLNRRSWIDLLRVCLGGVAATIPTLVANALLTGSPLSFPYSLAQGSMISPNHLAFGIRNLDAILASLMPMLHGWGWPWASVLVVLGLSLAPAALPFCARDSTRQEKLLLGIAVSVLLAHVVARAHGLHGFGPRYAFAACGPLWVLSACGVARLARMERRRVPAATVILALLIGSSAATLPTRLSLYRNYNDVSTDLRRAAAQLEPCSLVLIPEGNWRNWAAALPWLGREHDSEPLFAEDFGYNDELHWCYPDRTFVRWTGSALEDGE